MVSLLPPVGGRGRGPIRSSTHPGVTTAAGEPLGAEVVVAAGAEVAASVGADVVASSGEPLGACYLAALTGVEVVHSCRKGVGVPLVSECNDICLRAKCNNICTQDFSLGSPVVGPNSLDGGFKY
jgi:hypothetical protein